MAMKLRLDENYFIGDTVFTPNRSSSVFPYLWIFWWFLIYLTFERIYENWLLYLEKRLETFLQDG